MVSADHPPSMPYERLIINANWLMKLRWVAVVGQLTTIGAVACCLRIPVRLAPLLVAVTVTSATNLVYTIWLRRLARNRVRPLQTTHWYHVFTALMLLDLVVLFSLLYYTGGHANPFSLFYFVNLALAGMLLPAGRAWLLNAVTILSFAALFVFHEPLPELQRPETLRKVGQLSDITLAQVGMIVAFATCSSVIVYFVTRLTSEVKVRDQALRQSQMRQARSEKWEALGTLSAGAAHELATPLTTIAIVSKEMERELQGQGVSGQALADVEVIRKEVHRCRAILDRMSIDAGHATAEAMVILNAEELIESAMNELSLPADRVQISIDRQARDCCILVPLQSVSQALRGVLQNALDASPEQPVTLGVTRDRAHLRIAICDRGEGMTAEVLQRADEPFFTTKEAGKGMGLGRFLARAVFERLGGSFETESTPGVGTSVFVRVPLSEVASRVPRPAQRQGES